MTAYDFRLPATGRGPRPAGVQVGTLARPLVYDPGALPAVTLLRLPAPRYQPVYHDPTSQLPETPLHEPGPLRVENVVIGLASGLLVLGPGRILQLLKIGGTVLLPGSLEELYGFEALKRIQRFERLTNEGVRDFVGPGVFDPLHQPEGFDYSTPGSRIVEFVLGPFSHLPPGEAILELYGKTPVQPPLRIPGLQPTPRRVRIERDLTRFTDAALDRLESLILSAPNVTPGMERLLTELTSERARRLSGRLDGTYVATASSDP